VILLTELTEENLENAVTDILVQNEVWNFIIRLLGKFDDNEEDDRNQISRCLKLLDNILEEVPELAANKLMHVDTLIDWLLIFIEKGNPSSDNYL
jgi:hypothetical protein